MLLDEAEQRGRLLPKRRPRHVRGRHRLEVRQGRVEVVAFEQEDAHVEVCLHVAGVAFEDGPGVRQRLLGAIGEEVVGHGQVGAGLQVVRGPAEDLFEGGNGLPGDLGFAGGLDGVDEVEVPFGRPFPGFEGAQSPGQLFLRGGRPFGLTRRVRCRESRLPVFGKGRRRRSRSWLNRISVRPI